MPWVKLEDGFAEHPKVVAAGPLASWLHVAALCYCARQLTDGFVPERQLRSLVRGSGPLAERLVEVGLWERVQGGYRVHDYLEYQPSKVKVEGERRAAKERMKGQRSGSVRPNNERNSDEQEELFAECSPEVRRPRPDPSPTRPVT